jgi:NAD(P)-dependent dehydrogenase (short-subunit alcohol dehydrogenase family)
MMVENKQVLIFGATGNIGGATTRELIKRGWHVRAVTRTPGSDKAQILARLGAEVVQGDMESHTSLEVVYEGISRALSVQNWVTSGVDGEIRQGKLVADVAHSADDEFVKMWRWMAGFVRELGLEGLWAMVEASRDVSPELMDMESWLNYRHDGTEQITS